MDEIVSVVQFRSDRYLVIYKSGNIMEMILHYSDLYDTFAATFRKPNFTIPRTFP